MARGVNKVILIGNLGADPEIRVTPNNTQIVRVNVATSSGWKDKQSGEMQERTEWHRVVFFNRLAEIVSQYLKKGAKVYIEGSLRTSKYTDKNGIEKYSTEVIANEMQMLDRRGAGQNISPNDHPEASTVSHAAAPTTSAEFNDDIPF